ncbi:histidinol-phosphate transaminase [Mameliella sp. AT18]|uniref:histidinol-phosphate transaminase n=1 Tax=Mameliella sp. AT18 TaxID=3028385 RepID=UPI00237B5232|nr:histidinol-phosphate transaminase [Mameliella sp. AT18]MDD9730747.1 histidinol-phosphate transaminase [Mameliella sp. AT18]
MNPDLIRPEIAALPTYNAGLALDRFRAHYGIDCQAKLDSNENPAGPCPGVVEAIREEATGISRYPDAGNADLRGDLADATGASPDRIIVGNGSEDLIGALFRTVLRPGDHVVTICPSFGLHEFGALACGAHVTKVPFEADWSFPIDGLIHAMSKEAPRVLIFSSPSNPAGPAISPSDFDAVLKATPPETLVVFDEAYLEYLDADARFDAMGRLAAGPNPWIVLRTFSKAYGLAGIRVGYGIACAPELVAQMMKARNPFGVNALAVAAARAALRDPDYLARSVRSAIEGRAALTAGLTQTGFACAPSQTNFVFFDTGQTATDFAEALRHKGVLIKPWLEEPYTSWARVTVGTARENQYFLDAVASMRCPA